ncbi:MAG: TetR family transcriptional regulator [Meiothermus sp.]|nr:TetR family transcriptional regulator [Meiothermus sp.]
MKRLPMIAGSVALFVLSTAGLAQGVRSLGMGGLVLPGPAASYLNPAYAAFPSLYGSDQGLRLPIGLLGLLRGEANPLRFFYDRAGFASPNGGFDALTFYDQFTHLGEFLINPASSNAFVNPATGYPEINLEYSASGVQLTDYLGRPINLSLSLGQPTGVRSSGALTPAPLFSIPFGLGGGFYGDVGLFAGGFGLGVAPDANLRRAIASGRLDPDTDYALTGSASGQAGISLGFGFATALPSLPIPEFGTANIYVGARGEAFYGLGYFEGSGRAIFRTDGSGLPNQAPQFESTLFYSYPGAGFGFGIRADGGVALESQGIAAGLGVRNLLGLASWSGTQIAVARDGTSTTSSSSRGGPVFAPAFFLNAAARQALEVGEVVYGADLGYDGRFTTHIGGEYILGPGRVRAGLGWEDGLKFGLGAGFSGAGFLADAALTTHQAPIVGGTVFGIALSIGFSF